VIEVTYFTSCCYLGRIARALLLSAGVYWTR